MFQSVMVLTGAASMSAARATSAATVSTCTLLHTNQLSRLHQLQLTAPKFAYVSPLAHLQGDSVGIAGSSATDRAAEQRRLQSAASAPVMHSGPPPGVPKSPVNQ